MSNLYSKIAQIKRNQEPINMPFSQTHWINGKQTYKIPSKQNKFFVQNVLRKNDVFFAISHSTCILFTVETLNNSSVLMSPPHNNSLMQRESMLITQPSSLPSSPLASPGALSSTSFCLQSSATNTADIDTADPNWQATKPTVRERNAAMFNNDLMADIKFVVGSEGEF